MSYTTAEIVRFYAQVNYKQLEFENETDYDSFINDVLLPHSKRMIDEYCYHNFNSNAGTLLYDGNGKEVLYLASKSGLVNGVPAELMPVPILTVTAISIDGTPISTLTDVKLYEKYLAYDCGKFDKGRQNIEIVGTWGYNSVPDDIAQANAELCGNLLADMVRRKRMPDVLTPILEAGGDISPLFRHPNVMSKNLKQTLKKYKFKQIGGAAGPS